MGTLCTRYAHVPQMKTQQKQNQALFDVEPHRVCSSPNIWVFDNLLSESFLSHIDALFEASQEEPQRVMSWAKDRSQLKRAVEFPVVGDSRTSELAAVLRRISHTSSEVEVFPEARCVEVSGDPQHEHMDRHDWSRLTRFPIEDIVDINGRFSSPAELQGSTRIIPTLSFVIYFNAVGGCEFPAAGQTITGKRGRIIMFQNYIDEQRPAHDTQATHFGFYGNCPSQFGVNPPKRMMTGGILCNKVPLTLLGTRDCSLRDTNMKGIMYWGVCQGEHGGDMESQRCPDCGSVWCMGTCRPSVKRQAAAGDKKSQEIIKKLEDEDARRQAMNLEYEQRTRERKEAMAKAKAERKAREEIPGTDEFKAKERTK